MWAAIFGTAMVLAVAAVVFLWTRFCKFSFIYKIAGGVKWKIRLLALIPMVVLGVFCYFDLINTAVVMLHAALYWLIFGLIAFVIKKIRRVDKSDKGDNVKPGLYVTGIVVLCFEIIYFSAGWYLNHHVWETDYTLQTEKSLGGDTLRIAQFTDSHVGVTFDGEGFKEHLSKIQECNPDILVITGDFVDDDSNKADMLTCCEALKNFKCPYGVYFIYGNHDEGYFRNRDFSASELEQALMESGVIILEDDVVLVDDRFYVIGRADASDSGRKSMAELTAGLDQSKYMLVLDHQPNDFDAEAAAGTDLVLCGHTHGGQLFEIKDVGIWLGANDLTVGKEVRDKTTFIVSSGISDWAIKFKTGTKSEFCIIDVTGK